MFTVLYEELCDHQSYYSSSSKFFLSKPQTSPSVIVASLAFVVLSVSFCFPCPVFMFFSLHLLSLSFLMFSALLAALTSFSWSLLTCPPFRIRVCVSPLYLSLCCLFLLPAFTGVWIFYPWTHFRFWPFNILMYLLFIGQFSVLPRPWLVTLSFVSTHAETFH